MFVFCFFLGGAKNYLEISNTSATKYLPIVKPKNVEKSRYHHCLTKCLRLQWEMFKSSSLFCPNWSLWQLCLEEATSGCRYIVDWSTDHSWLQQLHPWQPAGLLPAYEGSSRLLWPTPPELWTCCPHCHGRNYESAEKVVWQVNVSKPSCVEGKVRSFLLCQLMLSYTVLVLRYSCIA